MLQMPLLHRFATVQAWYQPQRALALLVQLYHFVSEVQSAERALGRAPGAHLHVLVLVAILGLQVASLELARHWPPRTEAFLVLKLVPG